MLDSKDAYNFNHAVLHPIRIKRDEKDLKSLLDIIETTWLNPFDPNQPALVRLLTGTVTRPEFAQDLLDVHTIGETTYAQFTSAHLESSPPTAQYEDSFTYKQKDARHQTPREYI